MSDSTTTCWCIGSGPGGQKAAIAAAKLGKRVGVVERRRHGRRRLHQHRHDPVQDPARGGALPHRARTSASSTARATGSRTTSRSPDLLSRTQHVIGREIEVDPQPAGRNRVQLIYGTGRFVDPHTVAVRPPTATTERHVTADKIVIAAGTRPARPPHVAFDGAARRRLRRHPRPRAGARARWSSSAPASSASSTRRCSPRSAPGSPSSSSAAGCSSSATPRSSRRCSSTCATCRHVPLRRGGGQVEVARRRHDHDARRAASGSPPRPCCTRPAGRARPTRST